MKILIVNPGSTSTKIGLFEEENLVFEKVLRHSMDEIEGFEKVSEQYDFRMKVIIDALKEAGTTVSELAAICGMGGLIKPISSGTYYVNDTMVKDLKSGQYGDHASNLGGLIAHAIGTEIGKPAFIVDPVVVDEMIDVSRISGNPALERRSIFHALNQKATARLYSKEIGKTYDELNLVVVHMGGGISIGAHAKGQVIDCNNALDGDGPFTPERSGGLPSGQLAALCFSGDYTHTDVKALIKGKGGMVGYFGTNDMMELGKRAETEPEVKLVIDALALQVSKDIAAYSTVVCGQVDAIILTGGIAYSDYITSEIEKRVNFIAPVKRYPGENELTALNLGALRVLRGEEQGKEYQ